MRPQSDARRRSLLNRGLQRRAAGGGAGPGPALVVALALLLQACVVVPHTTETYDRECRMVRRQMGVRAEQVGTLMHCRADCGVVLVAMGAVAVASAVVSGTIAVAGNVVYWFEQQGRCPGRDADTDADFQRALAAQRAAAAASAASGAARAP